MRVHDCPMTIVFISLLCNIPYTVSSYYHSQRKLLSILRGKVCATRHTEPYDYRSYQGYTLGHTHGNTYILFKFSHAQCHIII